MDVLTTRSFALTAIRVPAVRSRHILDLLDALLSTRFVQGESCGDLWGCCARGEERGDAGGVFYCHCTALSQVLRMLVSASVVGLNAKRKDKRGGRN